MLLARTRVAEPAAVRDGAGLEEAPPVLAPSMSMSSTSSSA